MTRLQGSPVEPPFGCSPMKAAPAWLCFKCERPAGDCECGTPIHRFRAVSPADATGLHLIKPDVDTVVRRLGVPEAPDRRPRYFAEGPYVIVTVTRRRLNLIQAMEEARRLLERSIDPTIGSLADAYQAELSDLITAMRDALGNVPTPPAAIARAALA